MQESIFEKLAASIRGDDFYICIWAIAALVFFAASLILSHAIEKRLLLLKAERNISFSRYLNSTLTVVYSLFTTLVSLFPLLGMYGTVRALLGLGLAAGDLQNIKANFFLALTSTAWGIIFSIIFKVAHAFVVNYIECQIEESKKIVEENSIALLKKEL
ncbi:MAG: MotA/TolQ/ExbB proton channel family protein [Clostridia bacterium]|nr:MotA/TolQ/ExbB proton channel family protein [Clostridia bacterium]